MGWFVAIDANKIDCNSQFYRVATHPLINSYPRYTRYFATSGAPISRQALLFMLMSSDVANVADVASSKREITENTDLPITPFYCPASFP